MYKKGGAFIQKCFKRGGGHEPAVPPPPKSTTEDRCVLTWPDNQGQTVSLIDLKEKETLIFSVLVLIKSKTMITLI